MVDKAYKAIESEAAYLTDRKLARADLADTIVALRVNINQAMTCYTTSGQEHTMHMIRHMAGFIESYFKLNDFAVIAQPNPQLPSMGEHLVYIDLGVRRAEEAISRQAKGDAKSQLMTIMSLLLGCMVQYGVDERQGYEDAKD